MNRRHFLTLFLSGSAIAVVGTRQALSWPFGWNNKKEGAFPFAMSDHEWKEKLSPAAYRVLREQGTERAFTSPLTNEHRKGTFYCAGCMQALFSSEQKFDSGTGWPSFWAPMNDKAVATDTDYKIGYARTEVHCANCGGHLGHVFNDGPKPTGLRYCMNGVAMTFKSQE